MEFIDLLKIGSDKKEAVIAYNKISEPTIDYNGINMNAMTFLFLMYLEMGMSGSEGDLNADIFGEYSEGVFMLGKSAFDSTFGDVLHEGTYNFFTDTASIDEEILLSDPMLSVYGKGGINFTARVVRHPYLEGVMGSSFGEGVNMSIYSIIPDDIFINIILKQIGSQYMFGDSSSDETMFIMLLLPQIGIPFAVMSGDFVNAQYGEESVVMYGSGLYSMMLLE